jgi:LexA-binding, inner membrane-associated putative hydrolase
MRRTTVARAVLVYSDPLQHALIAAAVTAPLVPRAGRRVLVTGVVVATAIDVDHIVAARSARVRDTTALPERPQTHSLLTALTTGALVSAVAGPLHGWAAFGGLASHLLHDAGDRSAPTPLLWPFAPARQIGRRRQLAGTTLLTMVSAAIGRGAPAAARGSARGAAGAGGGRAARRRRTGSARS